MQAFAPASDLPEREVPEAETGAEGGEEVAVTEDMQVLEGVTEGGFYQMVDEEPTLAGRPKGHLPGDTVQIEIGFFRHEMHLKEVYAAFEHQDHEPFEILLRGLPVEAEPPSEGSRFSRVVLSTIVPSDAPPGLYRCQRLGVLTYGERRIPFDPDTEETWKKWQFWVREEPETPPTF